MPFNFEVCSRNVHCLGHQFQNVKDHQEYLLLSDLHWDNPHCDRKLLKRHLDEAVARDAGIIIIGDAFCLMESRSDGRRSGNVRPEHITNYFDSIVSTAADWFEPYKDHLLLVGQGNHEASVKKHNETDIIERFCQAIRLRGGIAQPGGYSGFIRFAFSFDSTRSSQVLFYHHGYGGGSRNTRGTGHFAAYQQMIAGQVDIFAAGHVHQKECFPVMMAALKNNNRVEQRTVHCVRLGTYKDEYADGHEGFHVEKGRAPRALGGYWLNFEAVTRNRLRKINLAFTEAN